jgi:hypothetical protein
MVSVTFSQASKRKNKKRTQTKRLSKSMSAALARRK